MSNDLQMILDVCIKVMGEGILSNDRYRQNVLARAVYYRCCRQLTDYSYEDIAATLGKNHATVIHGIKVFENDILSGFFSSYLEAYRDCIRICSLKMNRHKPRKDDYERIMELLPLVPSDQLESIKQTLEELVA